MTAIDTASTALLGLARDAASRGLQAKAAAGVGEARAARPDAEAVKAAAQDFESFFIGQMLEYMWEGVDVDPMFGGGHAEQMWRSMMNQEYGKHIATSGGLGLSSQVMTSMLKAQEERTHEAQAAAAGVGAALRR